ncbi:MAG: FHA domain-containing protein [Planctomycetota bacterium]|nr:MAG: FHA domain-containing protein [Planctomycetota bacterium]
MSSVVSVDLVVASGERLGRTFTLRPGQAFQIGRSPKTTIRLEDPLISRVHALVELRPEGCFVTDLGSSNGTFLDARRLEAHVPVEATGATELRIGDQRLLLSFEDEDEDAVSTRFELAPPLPRDEYELIGVLGEGEQGVVYSAEQKLLNRKVAVKVLRPERARDEALRERFLRQAWLCADVRSPHVVDVYDVRTYKGQVCMIMELVQGPSAADLLRGGPLPLPEVLRVGEHISRALLALQEAGIVHRAVKPSNILLDPSGAVKLCDFGAARQVLPTSGQLAGGATPVVGSFGTADYAAPELVRSAQATSQGDVYSLGVSLHHLARGGDSTPPRDEEGTLLPLSACGVLPAPAAAVDSLLAAMAHPDPEQRPTPAVLPELFRSLRVGCEPVSEATSVVEDWGDLLVS